MSEPQFWDLPGFQASAACFSLKAINTKNVKALLGGGCCLPSLCPQCIFQPHSIWLLLKYQRCRGLIPQMKHVTLTILSTLSTLSMFTYQQFYNSEILKKPELLIFYKFNWPHNTGYAILVAWWTWIAPKFDNCKQTHVSKFKGSFMIGVLEKGVFDF